MPTAALIDISSRHQVFLEGLKTGEVNDALKFLKKMDRDIRRRLGGVDLTEFTRTRLNKLLTAIRSDVAGTMGKVTGQILSDVTDLANYEAGFEIRSLNQVIDVSFVLPSPSQLKVAVFSNPLSIPNLSGENLIEPFIKQLSPRAQKRVSSAIRTGFFQGETTAKILQRIRGTRAAGFKDGVIGHIGRDIDTITRTALQHASSQARQAVWNSHPNIVSKVRWVSTLDGKTSAICRGLDGQTFALDKGPRPPIHPNACLKGTMILTNRGQIPIENVKVGDLIKTHMNRWRPVTTVMARYYDGAVRDLIDNLGSRVSFTNEHPVLTKNKGWIEVGNIEVGDIFFHDAENFSSSNDAAGPTFVPQAILIDSYNIKTLLTDELVSYGIFSMSAGVSSSVKLNNGSPDDEIRVISQNSFLTNIFQVDAIKNRCKQLFVWSWIFNKGFGNRISCFFNRLNIIGWVVDFHSFRRLSAAFGMSNGVSFAPMIIARRVIDKSLIINNRLFSGLCFDSVIETKLSDCAIAKPILSFNAPETFPKPPMFMFNKIFNLFKSYHNSLQWVVASCSSIVEYHHSGMVYNLSVKDDETYIANNIVVHNCRSATTAVLNDKFKRLSEGRTRSSRKPDGTVKSVSANQTYYDWLKDQPVRFQNEVIGPKRGKLLRDGGLSSQRFQELQLGKNFNPLTLDQMKKLEPVAFGKAKI